MHASQTFPAILPALSEILAFVSRHAERHGFSSRRCLQLQLGVEEVVVNICRHAYAGSEGEIEVTLGLADDRFSVEIRDRGVLFDPLAQPRPDFAVPLDEREEGGLGVFLVGSVFDEVRYRREGEVNVLELIAMLPDEGRRGCP